MSILMALYEPTGGDKSVPADVQIGLVDNAPSQQARISKRARNWRSFVTRFNLRGVAMRVFEGGRILPLWEQLQFWLKLRRLQRDRSHVHERYGIEHETLRQVGADDDQIRQLNHDEQYELGVINEMIYQLYSQRIITQAERLFVRVPDLQDDREQWEVAKISRRWRLRRQALQDLVAAIRKADKERREAAQMKLMWLAGLTGILGVVTGLISVMTR